MCEVCKLRQDKRRFGNAVVRTNERFRACFCLQRVCALSRRAGILACSVRHVVSFLSLGYCVVCLHVHRAQSLAHTRMFSSESSNLPVVFDMFWEPCAGSTCSFHDLVVADFEAWLPVMLHRPDSRHGRRGRPIYIVRRRRPNEAAHPCSRGVYLRTAKYVLYVPTLPGEPSAESSPVAPGPENPSRVARRHASAPPTHGSLHGPTAPHLDEERGDCLLSQMPQAAMKPQLATWGISS